MGALLGDDTVYADAGDFVFKPRDQWHTFWNAGDEPCRILEVICPGGFEHYFDEFAEIRSRPDFSPEMIGPTAATYGIEFDLDKVPALCEEHGLVFPLADSGTLGPLAYAGAGIALPCAEGHAGAHVGRIVMFRRRASSGSPVVAAISKRRTISAITTFISKSAKLEPRQRRRPPPKGIHV